MVTATKPKKERPKPSEKPVISAEYYKLSEVSRLMNVSEATVVSWIDTKELIASDLSTKEAKKRLFRIAKTDLHAFIQRRMTGKSTAKASPKLLVRDKGCSGLDHIKVSRKGIATKHSEKQ